MENLSNLLLTTRWVAVLVLVLTNGFFVAAEFSLVAVRRTRVKQLVQVGHPLAPAVQRAVDSLDVHLAATQLGITMSSIALGWIGEPVLANSIEPVFSFLPRTVAQVGAHSLATALAFTIITTLHIVLGELAPKSFALQRTEQAAMATARPLELFLFLFRPAIVLLNSLGYLALRLLGLTPGKEGALLHSIEELRLLIESGREAGLLGVTEEGMLEKVLHLRTHRVDGLMTPRTAIVWLDLSDSRQEIQRKVVESKHSRFPVCRGTLDNVVGVVKARDLLQYSATSRPIDLVAVMYPPLLVPKNIGAVKLLEQFKKIRTRLALVIDDYGVQGLTTLYDVSEAIVGEVPTLDEPDDLSVVRRADGSWLLGGSLPIGEFKEIFGLRSLPGGGRHYRTLAGFLMMQLGRIPSEGEHLEWGTLHFEVVDMDRHRIDKIIAKPR
jgi:putative hemolysin